MVLRGNPLHVFLHQGFGHVLSNTGPLLVLGILISLRGGRKLLGASLFIVAFGGFAVWLVARSGVHIGASGLAFGYFGYLVGRGFYEAQPYFHLGSRGRRGLLWRYVLWNTAFPRLRVLGGAPVWVNRGSGILKDHPHTLRVKRDGFALALDTFR